MHKTKMIVHKLKTILSFSQNVDSYCLESDGEYSKESLSHL